MGNISRHGTEFQREQRKTAGTQDGHCLNLLDVAFWCVSKVGHQRAAELHSCPSVAAFCGP